MKKRERVRVFFYKALMTASVNSSVLLLPPKSWVRICVVILAILPQRAKRVGGWLPHQQRGLYIQLGRYGLRGLQDPSDGALTHCIKVKKLDSQHLGRQGRLQRDGSPTYFRISKRLTSKVEEEKYRLEDSEITADVNTRHNTWATN